MAELREKEKDKDYTLNLAQEILAKCHPDAVNSVLSVTDNVVMTGCEDGNVRAVHLYPHRFLGVVGHHEGELPIEKMDVSGSGEMIASISHDNR